MNDNVELLPCPACKGEARDNIECNSVERCIECSKCSFTAFISDWNTRATPSLEDIAKIEAEKEKVKDGCCPLDNERKWGIRRGLDIAISILREAGK